MKKLLLIILVSAGCFGAADAQVYFSKAAKISFDATAAKSPEEIKGTTRGATVVLDISTGQLQFSMLIKSFVFERSLMEEHFNENYLESDKYPKAEFKGTIQDNKGVNYTKDGTYNVQVKGTLQIHGVTQTVDVPGKIIVAGGKIQATAEFRIKLSDYKVKIPGLVADKVAETASINVDCQLEPLKR